ncbi:MAG: DUF3604 domain-containing protein [Rhodobacteraceae bacterium]|nr:DUF3604 domain-containing protein [Paracoccaceae bacterium]
MAAYEAATGGRVLAIPPNGNLSNGLMFAFETCGGAPLTRDHAERRQRFEPIHEVTQIKGDGEAHPSLSPEDEFADFETWDDGNLNLTPKEPGMIAHEYYHEALKNGMRLDQEIGATPSASVRQPGRMRIPHCRRSRRTISSASIPASSRRRCAGSMWCAALTAARSWAGAWLRPATPRSGRPRTRAKRSGTPWPAARPMPRPARGWLCTSSAAGISSPKMRLPANRAGSATTRAYRWAPIWKPARTAPRRLASSSRPCAIRSAAISTESRSSRAGWMPAGRPGKRSSTWSGPTVANPPGRQAARGGRHRGRRQRDMDQFHRHAGTDRGLDRSGLRPGAAGHV